MWIHFNTSFSSSALFNLFLVFTSLPVAPLIFPTCLQPTIVNRFLFTICVSFILLRPEPLPFCFVLFCFLQKIRLKIFVFRLSLHNGISACTGSWVLLNCYVIWFSSSVMFALIHICQEGIKGFSLVCSLANICWLNFFYVVLIPWL